MAAILTRPQCVNAFFIARDSIGAQLQLALAKADSEQLARSIAEEQLADVEKEKTMLELELKENISRNKSDGNKREMTISSVRSLLTFFLLKFTLQVTAVLLKY